MINEREERQRKERLQYVELWAEYVRTHPDSDWSALQANLVNAELAIMRRIMTKEAFLEMKGELRK